MMKLVIFDLDGTLLDRDASVEQFVSVQFETTLMPFSSLKILENALVPV